MKKLLKFISMYGWKHQRKEEKLNYLVVDMNTYGEYNGGRFGTSHFEAYKTDEFETLEKAQDWIDKNIAKKDLMYIRIYKLLQNE